jgi:hypothetical protein
MYKIPVKLEGIERRKRSTGLLHIVAGFFLIANAAGYYKQIAYSSLSVVAPVFIVAFISLVYGFLRKRLDPAARYNYWVRMIQLLTFAVLAITMVQTVSNLKLFTLVLWAVVILFLMFTERKIFHDTDLQIKTEGIYVPGYFKSYYMPWHIISAFVLRKDYLTITRNNQKYVQVELLKDMTANEIEEINAFSQQQIQQPTNVVVAS